MKVMRFIGTALAVLVLFVGVASADLLQSQAGLATCVNPTAPLAVGYSGPVCPTDTTTQVVKSHPSWEHAVPPLGSYPSLLIPPQWISYADTGYEGTQFQPFGGADLAHPDVNKWIFQVFQPIAAGHTFFHLEVWADDTAGVYLDGVQLKGPVFTQSTCSGQPIGCLPQDVGTFDMPLTAGAHMLRFDVYQVGTGTTTTSNPMALLYAGEAVPEPAGVVLFGTVLVGVVTVIRRKLA